MTALPEPDELAGLMASLSKGTDKPADAVVDAALALILDGRANPVALDQAKLNDAVAVYMKYVIHLGANDATNLKALAGMKGSADLVAMAATAPNPDTKRFTLAAAVTRLIKEAQSAAPPETTRHRKLPRRPRS